MRPFEDGDSISVPLLSDMRTVLSSPEEQDHDFCKAIRQARCPHHDLIIIAGRHTSCAKANMLTENPLPPGDRTGEKRYFQDDTSSKKDAANTPFSLNSLSFSLGPSQIFD